MVVCKVVRSGPYKKSITKWLYFMYLLMGGALIETSLNFKLRSVYILWQTFLYVFCIVTSLPCLYLALRADKIDLSYIFFSCFGAAMPMCVLNVTCGMIYCNGSIKSALRSVDIEFQISWTKIGRQSNARGDDFSKEVSIQGWIFLLLFIEIISASLFIPFRYVTAASADPENILHNYHFYFLPFVFMDNIDSLTAYALVSFGHILVGSLTVIMSGCIPIFIIAFGSYIHNQFRRLVSYIEVDSRETEKMLMNCEKCADDCPMADQETDQLKKFILAQFGRRCILYLQTYRNFLRAAQHLRPLISVMFTVLCFACLSCFVPLFCWLRQEATPLSTKLSIIAVLLMLSLLLFSCCYVGKLMDDINDAMTFAIYDVPWFYLQKREQKMVLVFLIEIQQTPLIIKSLKVYQVTMAIFPKVMNFNFTIINLIRYKN